MYNMKYRHCRVIGSSYELGYALGEQLRSDDELIKGITTPLFGGEPLTAKQVDKTARLFEKYIPGINDEIKGFSDAAGVSFTDMVIYSSYLDISGGCSHFVITRNKDNQKSIIHARNYDYNFSDPLIMITINHESKYDSTGFSCKIFGRFDGINEHGLCVTTSAADVRHEKPFGDGYVFPMVVRALLDTCANVYEAKELLMEIPYAEYRNFIISDKTSAAMLVEASPVKKSYKHIDADDNYGFLCSADHYILDQCDVIRPVEHSIVRQKVMEEKLAKEMIKTPDDVKELLSKRYPEGLSFPYYESGMGTLWSVIYDPLTASQYTCFGSPESGVWEYVDQNCVPGCTEKIVQLFNEQETFNLWG